MTPTVMEINLGATICSTLKLMYFPEAEWVTCYRAVGLKFTELKERMRKFDKTKDTIALLQELLKYSQQDLVDVFETPELRTRNEP